MQNRMEIFQGCLCNDCYESYRWMISATISWGLCNALLFTKKHFFPKGALNFTLHIESNRVISINFSFDSYKITCGNISVSGGCQGMLSWLLSAQGRWSSWLKSDDTGDRCSHCWPLCGFSAEWNEARVSVLHQDAP